MCELEDELVNDTVDAQRPTDQFELGICRVIEDEVVLVKAGQLYPTNATSELGVVLFQSFSSVTRVFI